MPDYNTIFIESVQRPEIGGWREYPIAALLEAMKKRDGENAGFFRKNSYVVVIVLTNEDEQDEADSGVNPSTLMRFFRENMSSQHKGFRMYGILIIPNDENCLREQKFREDGTETTVGYAHKVTELINLTGGTNASICATTYSRGLEGIGQDALQFISPELTLDEIPLKEGDLQVLLMPSGKPLNFSLDGNQIKILSKLPREATLEIHYSFAKK